MKKAGIFFRYLFLFLFLVSVAVSLLLNHIYSGGNPSYKEDVYLRELKNQVDVYYDQAGIPHVVAKNEEDLYKVTGYLMAKERMWQMDLLRRVTQGRISEIFGDDLIDTDVLMRSLRITTKSENLFKSLSPEIKKSLEAYSNGVNQYIREKGKDLSFEFQLLSYTPEEWKPIHTINILGYISWDLSTAWPAELSIYKIMKKHGKDKCMEFLQGNGNQSLKMFDERSSKDRSEIKDLEKFFAASEKLHQLGAGIFESSNNWAVDCSKSSTGKPFLANDMHLGYMIPGIWMQMHSVIPGKLNVSGVTIPGSPFVVCGHTDSIAWGMTNTMLDDIDFYEESISESNPLQYKLDGKYLDFEITKEVIRSKEKVITKEIRYTRRGPVISEMDTTDRKTISMKWIGNEESNEIRSVFLINRAQNIKDFKNAFKSFVSISQNIAYADKSGNIGLYCCAGIPLRDAASNWVQQGDTSLHDWQGLIPFDSLPSVYNPKSGYVCSANTSIYSKNPLSISQWYEMPWRYAAIDQSLSTQKKFNADSFKFLQKNLVSEAVKKYLPIILNVLEKNLTSKLEQDAWDILKNWDGKMDKESPCPSIFDEFLVQLLDLTLEDELTSSELEDFRKSKLLVRHFTHYLMTNKKSQWLDDIRTRNKVEDFNQIVQMAFRRSINKLSEELGEDVVDWQWGKIHQLTIKHPLSKVKILDRIFHLNRGPFPMSGSYHTIENFAYSYNKPFDVHHGPSQRHIYDLSNWDHSWIEIPTGTSGVPSSEFYCNQTDMYIQNQYIQENFSMDKVLLNKKYHQVFKEKK